MAKKNSSWSTWVPGSGRKGNPAGLDKVGTDKQPRVRDTNNRPLKNVDGKLVVDTATWIAEVNEKNGDNQ